ncbi:MAG: hypothetical protein JO115_06035 [Pseudonocardiales bacterium]|nr:hypothetical protein [Pseudonocardiales bacterium]
MALPLTKSAVEALGKRLVTCSPPASDDIELLQKLLLAYDEPLAIAMDLVRHHLRQEPTSRIKTTRAILDKLHRNGGSILKGMQDLAGMRIVSDCDRQEQDRLAEDLMRLFTEYGDPLPKRIDRREHPSHGYRAVHVIVYINGAPVEIQLRTKLQHEWANLFEKLVDRVGRGIRYGEPPEHWLDQTTMLNMANDEIRENLYRTSYKVREVTVSFARSLSDVIDAYERHAMKLNSDELTELNTSIANGFAVIQSHIDEMEPRTPPTSS